MQKDVWTSVDDQLPGNYWVLIQAIMVPEDVYAIPRVATYIGGAWLNNVGEEIEDVYKVKVTHWTTLPEFTLRGYKY